MKTKKLDFTWIEKVEDLVKNPKFCKTISDCQALLEEINLLVPSSHMKHFKLNLTLVVDLLDTCRKQTFRVTQLRRPIR